MQFSYNSCPSLQRASGIRVAIALLINHIKGLTDKDFKNLIEEREIRKFGENVRRKYAGKLSLPEPIERNLFIYIYPITYELICWLNYSESILGVSCRTYIDKICWTTQGTVDKIKTVEVLVRDESISISDRYRLSCCYCLEDFIDNLWNRLNGEDFPWNDHDEINKYELPLVSYWSHHVEGKIPDFCNTATFPRDMSVYEYVFHCAVDSANLTATKYFLEKLTPERKKHALPRDIDHVAGQGYNVSRLWKKYYYEVFCFLLSEMNEDVKVQLLEKHSLKILDYLLHFPLQDFFLETAKDLDRFLNVPKIQCLSHFIAMNFGRPDYNYQRLFTEFWREISSSIRDNYDQFPTGLHSILLSVCFYTRDHENARLMLRSVSDSEREGFILDNDVLREVFRPLIRLEEWNNLKLFISECISSIEVMIRLKAAIRSLQRIEEFEEKYIGINCHWCIHMPSAQEKVKWDVCFDIIDDFIVQFGEREKLNE